MQAAGKKKEAQGGNQEIPTYLIYEVLEGKPIYYKGYQEVLVKNKTLEDIMGSSGLQLVIIEYLLRVCYAAFEASVYRVLTNEAGSHIGKNNNLSNKVSFHQSYLVADAS